jgi:hypothetical protein
VPWRLVDTIAALIGIIGAFLTWYLPKAIPYVQLASWLIPFVLFAPIFLFRFILSPYWVLLDEKKSSQDVRTRLRSIEESQPRIVFHSVREAPLFRRSNITQRKKRPIYRIVQVWFVNSPTIPNERSEAKSVSAVIEFRNRTNPESIIKVYGQWAVDNPPDFVGSANYSPIVEIPPGQLPVKLNIVLKYTSEVSAYAFSLEGLTRDPDGRDPSYEIIQGIYDVVIYLKGVGVDEKFIFELENPGKDSNLLIRPILMKPTS